MNRKILATLAICSAFSTPSHAGVLDFSETGVNNAVVGGSTVNLSNATLTGLDTSIFIGAPFSFGDSNGLGIACGTSPSGACNADWRIDFLSEVTNLTFASFAVETDDVVDVSAFLHGVLLGAVHVASATSFDLSALGAIDALLFDDQNSASAGIGFGDFSFNAVAVPQPASLPLFAAGLLAYGVQRRRRA